MISARPSVTYPLREASVVEQDAATAVAERLDRAADRGMDEATVAYPVPPGRVDMSQAMQADAQAYLGLPASATPFRRRQRRILRRPAQRVGIAIDHSPSMHDVLDAAVAAAWVVELAASRARQARSTVALSTFDTTAHLVESGSTTHVPVLSAAAPGAVNHSSALPESLELLRGQLELDHFPDDSRLVVVISDSVLAEPERVAHAIDDLHASGVRVLWISIDEDVPAYLPAATATLTATKETLMRALPDAVTQALSDTENPEGYQ